MKRILQLAAGLVLGVATLLLSGAAFFVSLLRCRAENVTHYPATCPLGDHHPGVLVFALVGLSVCVFILGLTRVRRAVPIALAGVVTALYVGYAFSVEVT